MHRLGGVGRLLPNPHLLIGPHLRIEAVLSSRIEGTKTEVTQLLRVEAGEKPTPDEADDAREVRNYIVAMQHGIERIREGFPVSIRLFREMHEHLLAGARGQHRLPGELRQSPVWIGGNNLTDAVFVPPPPDEMVRALSDLERFSINALCRCWFSSPWPTTSSKPSIRSWTATAGSAGCSYR